MRGFSRSRRSSSIPNCRVAMIETPAPNRRLMCTRYVWQERRHAIGCRKGICEAVRVSHRQDAATLPHKSWSQVQKASIFQCRVGAAGFFNLLRRHVRPVLAARKIGRVRAQHRPSIPDGNNSMASFNSATPKRAAPTSARAAAIGRTPSP